METAVIALSRHPPPRDEYPEEIGEEDLPEGAPLRNGLSENEELEIGLELEPDGAPLPMD